MIVLNIISLILMIIGSINMGLIGFFNYDLLGLIFGMETAPAYGGFSRFIFAIIGLAGLWGLSFLGRVKFLGGGSGGCCGGSGGSDGGCCGGGNSCKSDK